MGDVNPADEQRHEHTDEPLWNESYYFDFFAPDGGFGGYLRIGFIPNLNTVWYWACAVGPGRSLVTLVDNHVPLPASASSLELRTDGLWADHNIEDPLVHASANLEAFALRVDDPAEMYRAEPRGERVPFGFELDWETDHAAYLWPPVTPRYEIPCRVHGRVMIGDEEIELDGFGQRDHSWGASRDWWANTWCWNAGRLDDGTRFHSTGGFLPGTDLGVGYVMDPDGTLTELSEVSLEAELGREGFAERASLGLGGDSGPQLDVQPLAFSPVLLVHPDGRQDRFPRAMARFAAADGRNGLGWIEWNQPPPAE
jgi:hypothetical protein